MGGMVGNNRNKKGSRVEQRQTERPTFSTVKYKHPLFYLHVGGEIPREFIYFRLGKFSNFLRFTAGSLRIIRPTKNARDVFIGLRS